MQPTEELHTATLDPLQIRQSYEAMLTPLSPDTRKQVDTYLREAEKNPYLYHHQIAIYSSDSPQPVRLQALLHLKALLQRHYPTQRAFKRSSTTYFQQEAKEEIRAFLLDQLYHQTNTTLRKVINAMLAPVIKQDFPSNYPGLQNYLIQGLQQVNAHLAQKQLQVVFRDETRFLLGTLKHVFIEQSKKRAMNSKKAYQEYTYPIQVQIQSLWQFGGDNLSQLVAMDDQTLSTQKQQVEQFLVFNSRVDQILLLLLLTSHNEAHDDEMITSLIPPLLNKAKTLLQLLEKVGQVKGLAKGINKVLVGLGQVQASQPLAMKDTLENYLSILEMVVRMHRKVPEEVLRGALLGFIKTLKTYVYYSDSQAFLSGRSPSKLKNYHEQQVICTLKYNEFFSAQKIELVFYVLLYEILPGQLVDEEGLANVENEIDNTLDETVSELDNTVQRLILCLVDLLFNRFQAHSLAILKQLLLSLPQQSLGIQDSLLTVLCLVPRIYERNYDKQSQHIHGDQVKPTLQWLHSQLQISFTPVYLRRMPLLVTRWLRLLSPDLQAECFVMVVSLLSRWQESHDLMGTYQCCLCLRDLLSRKDLFSLLQPHLPLLLPAVLPVVLHLLVHTDLPTVLWPLISFLSLSLESSQRTLDPSVLACFNQEAKLDCLLGTTNEMVKESLVDMFKHLLVVFPPLTLIPQIFKLALRFLTRQLSLGLHNIVLRLWYFLIKEYSPAQGLDDQVLCLFQTFLPQIETMNTPDNLALLIYILEEYLLLQLLPVEQLPQVFSLLHSLYQKINPWPITSQLPIKVAINNTITTCQLLLMQNRKMDYSLFTPLLNLVLHDFLLPCQQSPLTSDLLSFNTSLTSILNRFIIHDLPKALTMISHHQVSLESFLSNWMTHMLSITSKNACKINSIALLTMLPHLPIQTIQPHLQELVKRVLPDVITYADEQAHQPGSKANRVQNINSRLNENKTSLRKEEIRRLFLFDEVDLKSLFLNALQQVNTALIGMGMSVEALLVDPGLKQQVEGLSHQ